MAGEITAGITFSFSKGGVTMANNSGGLSIDVSGTKAVRNVIAVGTGDESLALGDVGTIGYCLFHNLDATNFISIGSDGTLYPLKLKAGEWALCRWNAAAIHVKSDTATTILDYTLIDT